MPDDSNTGGRVEPLTYADLLSLPGRRSELIGGKIVTRPSQVPVQSYTAFKIAHAIGDRFDLGYTPPGLCSGPGGWWVLGEIDVEFGPHDVVRPDVMAWRRERLADGWETRPLTVPPDWVCEVTSLFETLSVEHLAKAMLYARHGVKHLWLVDPFVGAIEVMELVAGCWESLGSYRRGYPARIPPFIAVELDLLHILPPPGGRD